jgi:hypothetical protein
MGIYQNAGLCESEKTSGSRNECSLAMCATCKHFGFHATRWEWMALADVPSEGRFGEKSKVDDSEGHYVCKKKAPSKIRKIPWPEMDEGDVCGDYSPMAGFECGDPGCPACTGTRRAPRSAGGAPLAAKETDRQRAFKVAFAAADTGQIGSVPVSAVRDEFKVRHPVSDPDPKRANKVRLDAWTWALRDLPPGFSVDKESSLIRRNPS